MRSRPPCRPAFARMVRPSLDQSWEITKRPKETETMDDLLDGAVNGHQALCIELAERNVQCPLAGRDRAQAIEGKIDTLTDPYAGVTNQQESIAGNVVAANELFLNETILLGRQRPREAVIETGKVVGMKQACQGGLLVKPSQFFHDAAQGDDMQTASALDQPQLLRGEPAKPAQKVIPPKLIERLDSSMILAQVAEKVLDSCAITALRGGTQRRRHGLDGGEEGLLQWMNDGNANATHARDGTGRISCAMARTYC